MIVDGSPEPSSSSLVERLAREADYVIAADRGAELLHAIGLVPDVFCGDDDSVGGIASAWAHEGAKTDIRFPSEKYATDLALAIDCARHEAARRGAALRLTLTCASGGRPDHALAVLGCLAGAADARPVVVEDGFVCRVMSPAGCARWEVGREDGALGATFSAIPLVEGTVVSEAGMRWGLDRRALPLLSDEGLSNVIEHVGATVACHEGLLAAFLVR